MRYYITALLIAFPILIFAQEAEIFCIDSLPTEGVILRKNWKFIIGDNPDYASSSFIDTNWQPIATYTDISYLQQIPKNGEIMWLRLSIFLDSNIREPLAMMIDQVGASEMYLDGKLIHKFGILTKNPREVKGFSPHLKPYLLPLEPNKRQVLAIRYAIQPDIRYSFFMGHANRLLRIVVSDLYKTMTMYQNKYVFTNNDTNLKVGVFGVLGLMFFVFYWFYPTQKSNFYFFIYTCLYAVFMKIFAYRAFSEIPDHWIWYYWAILIINFIASMCLLTGIYRLFNQKINWVYWGLLILGIIAIPCGIYISWGWTIPMMLFILLLYGVITRIALKATKRKQKGAMIIALGGIGVFGAWFFCLLGLIFPSVFFEFYTLFQSITIMALPIAIAIYMGYDAAMTNRSLQEKLKEVENLSDEKQQILIFQKETLENQVNERTAELSQTLNDLKTTQGQLIQIETQQKLNQERTRIARDMHDDISSGLSAINLLANYIKDTPLSTDTHLEIKHIAESSTELNQRIREIIWSVSSDSDNVEGLVHFLRRYVSEFGDMQHISTQFIAPDNLSYLTLSNEVKRNLFLCVKEALNNTAKYAKATLVTVSIDVKDHDMILRIQDNGVGFDKDKALKNGGNGLKNIRERMKQVGGDAVFLNEKGTNIILTCKI